MLFMLIWRAVYVVPPGDTGSHMKIPSGIFICAQYNTRKLVDILNQGHNSAVVNLSSLSMSYYDYDHANREDEFIDVVNRLLEFKTIVFATPVYWYSMSAQMKTFFDRTSDLLNIRKSLGKALKGRNTYLVSTGTDMELPEGFEVPFKRTSDYFEMNYKGSFYARISEDLVLGTEVKEQAWEFKKEIFSSASDQER